MPDNDLPRVAETGIRGLDDILGGGLPSDHIYVLQGTPGTGKTTIGLQFLLHGASEGMVGLYVSLSETKQEIQEVSRSHGWPLENIALQEVSAQQESVGEDDTTLFHPAEIQLGETMQSIFREIDRVRPVRIVIDSLSEVRLLSQNPLRYRRQILGLKQFLASRHCTGLLLDDAVTENADMHLQTISHGVVKLEQLAPLFGAERRRLSVTKLRGVKFRGGYHDFKIETGGVVVYPRLVAAEHRHVFESEAISAGLTELDALLGGGIDRGTTTLIMGPAGTGKSAIAAQYASAAARRGERVMMFTFDEGLGTFFTRTEALGIPMRRLVENETIRIQPIDPAELSPGEFTHLVCRSVEDDDARMIVIDSLSGYYNAMPEERLLTVQLHELFTYLRQRGVVVLLTLPQHGFLGPSVASEIDVSYLADTVILLRYFETEGEVLKAISVLKKRSGRHETTIRQLLMDGGGLRVGRPLKDFHGVLMGSPIYRGADAMTKDRNDAAGS